MKIIPILAFLILLLFAFACQQPENRTFETGVSKELAQMRVKDISKVSYLLDMEIPDSIKHPILANSTINLHKKDLSTPLVLDFVTEQSKVFKVLVNDEKVFYQLENEHLIIPAEYLREGSNKVEIAFEMGEGALNRNENYLYSLFVPDRARTVLPCFDQPDIKASISYSIKLPKDWVAITNGQKDFEEDVSKSIKHVTFAPTKPISTYLWSFAIGEFREISVQRNDISVSLFHMENDLNKLKKNLSPSSIKSIILFDGWRSIQALHIPFKNMIWYVFHLFQFAGMEHPGAVYYRNEMLFLGENPTQKELLKRAQLIAHETAHMWFGNLVTMKWFSGVWQKEVFANFMADKIVKEQFPMVNHDLTFLIHHFPLSYSVDRTEAANPIEQKLDNLKDAASMYGTIIYHKAPIVMNQLENLMGEELLRVGLKKYLNKYQYGNASWSDLIDILNNLSEYDIELWSRNWVNTPGRPVIEVKWEDDALMVKQHPEYADSSNIWSQRIKMLMINDSVEYIKEIELLSARQEIDSIQPTAIIPSINALGYGLFVMDSLSVDYCLKNIQLREDDLQQGVMLVNLYENLLQGNFAVDRYVSMLQAFIKEENNEQLIVMSCSQLSTVYWEFLTQKQQQSVIADLEDLLLNKVKEVDVLSIKKQLLFTWSNIVSTEKGLRKLKNFVQKQRAVDGIKFTDRELAFLTFELVLRDKELDDAFVKGISAELEDEDVVSMMEFVSPVFSLEETVRNTFIESLQKIENRKKENWVLSALLYIHHPYLQEANVRYLPSALEITTELKDTGSLFFPMNWIQTTLDGYGSDKAIDIVDYFFKDTPQYPEDLKRKVQQALDMVKRES